MWADNIFLVTSSASEAKRRTQEVANVFKKKKLFFIQSSLEILPSRAAEKGQDPLCVETQEGASLGTYPAGAWLFPRQHGLH